MVRSKNRQLFVRNCAPVFVFFLLYFFTITTLISCDNQEGPNEPALAETVPTPVASSLPTPAATYTTKPPPLPTIRPRRLSMGELVLAADIDDIPAIFADDTIFVDAAAGSQEWVDEELVIGVVINGDARAYPIRLLSSHEIVNDTVGGEPVAISWCPLCFTAIVFSRVIEDQELTFGVSGYLYFNNLVMYDHRTNTLWSQVAGEGLRGAYRGERLEVRPSQMTSWGNWKAAYPETLILSAQQLDYRVEAVIDPYAGYYTSGAAGLTGWANPNELLPAKELVVGLAIGRQARAYPLVMVREVGLVEDEIGGIPLLLFYNPTLESVVVYRRDTAEGVLNFQPGASTEQLEDMETNSMWEVRNGRATAGPLAGTRLARLAAPLVYWFAWSDIHTHSDVYNIPLK